MLQTTLFKSNKSQAVAMAEHVREVDVVVAGNRRIINPSGTAWNECFDEGETGGFMSDRAQPIPQLREALDD